MDLLKEPGWGSSVFHDVLPGEEAGMIRYLKKSVIMIDIRC
jgi:hypothetical protein